ncbi:MAG: YceD family protein [Actinomycetota bacterium]|nr:YceD family protein [Actinomycetota bacterium]
MNSLDPRSALVLDTHALGLQRRPGSMITVNRSAPAPGDMGIALARVLPDSPIEFALRLESVMEGVLVSGDAELQVSAECARCLEPLTWEEAVDISELFAYPATDSRGAIVEEPEDDQDPLPSLEGDLINLEPTLRDSVVLALPMAPLCREDCAGLCSECGVRLDDHPGHEHQIVDPRWAALAELAKLEPGKATAEALPEQRNS